MFGRDKKAAKAEQAQAEEIRFLTEQAGNRKSVRREARWAAKDRKRLGEHDPDRKSRYNED